MDAPLRLGLGHPLHPVDAALVLQPAVDLVALDGGDHFFQPSDGRRAGREHFHFPALRLGEAGVHPEELLGEEGGLVAAGAGADLDQHVLFVVRVLGQEQQLQLLFELPFPLLEPGQLLVGQLLHLRVVEQAAGLAQALFHLFPLAVLLHQGAHLGVGLGQLLVAGAVGQHLGAGELLGQALVARLHLVEFVKHRRRSHASDLLLMNVLGSRRQK